MFRAIFSYPWGWVILFFKTNRHIFICQPKVETSQEKESNIQAFSEKYAVDQDLVLKYIHYLAYLNMMKQKRERERREKAERESILTVVSISTRWLILFKMAAGEGVKAKVRRRRGSHGWVTRVTRLGCYAMGGHAAENT